MELCRICLKHRKKLISMYDNVQEKEFNYCNIIEVISSVKVFIKDEENTTNLLCLLCCKKLREAYEFKLLIEQSDAVLQNTHHKKRFIFNNFHDIKFEIEIPSFKAEPTPTSQEYITEKFKEIDKNSFIYKNISITKVECANETESMNVDEFLDSINDATDGYCSDAYSVKIDSNDEEYTPYGQNVKRIEKKRFHQNTDNNKELINSTKPIKPVLLESIRVKRTTVPKVRTTEKKKTKRVNRSDICPQCGKWFRYLKGHMLTHMGDKSFKCEMCNKKFYSQASLDAHVIYHDIRIFKCDSCVATFNRIDSLANHKLIHTGEKKFICEICSKAFARKSHLTRHRALVHNVGVRYFECEHCHKVCKTKAALKHHLRVHTGERPYKCEICSQPYSYKHDFNIHCFKKHGVVLHKRSIYVLNEEVLQRERILIKQLAQHSQGLRGDFNFSEFEGGLGYKALEQTLCAIKSRKVPLNV